MVMLFDEWFQFLNKILQVKRHILHLDHCELSLFVFHIDFQLHFYSAQTLPKLHLCFLTNIFGQTLYYIYLCEFLLHSIKWNGSLVNLASTQISHFLFALKCIMGSILKFINLHMELNFAFLNLWCHKLDESRI